jgi:hypothetical protein
MKIYPTSSSAFQFSPKSGELRSRQRKVLGGEEKKDKLEIMAKLNKEASKVAIKDIATLDKMMRLTKIRILQKGDTSSTYIPLNPKKVYQLLQ